MTRARPLVLSALLAAAVSLGVSYGVHAFRSARAPVVTDPLAALDLSLTQQKRIREISRRFHPRLLAMQAAVDRKRSELADLLAGAQAGDESALAACLREISRLEAERDQEVVRNLLELKPHLTVEQQQALFHYIELRHMGAAQPR